MFIHPIMLSPGCHLEANRLCVLVYLKTVISARCSNSKSPSTTKYTPSAQMCTCCSHLIKYAEHATCVELGRLGIPQCLLPVRAAAMAETQTSLQVHACLLRNGAFFLLTDHICLF